MAVMLTAVFLVTAMTQPVLLQSSPTSLYEQVNKDLQDFLKTENGFYANSIRPRLQPNASVTVSVDIGISTILSVNERDKSVSAMVWISINWHDDILESFFAHWANAPSSLVLLGSKVWTPDLLVFGDQTESSVDTTNIPVTVNSDGDATLVLMSLRTIKCKFRMTYFPFDKHFCEIGISSYISDDSDIIFTQIDRNNTVKWHVDHDEWYQTGLTIGVDANTVIYDFYLQRKPNRSLLSIVLPTIIFSVLISASFWLPHETGERVSYTITLFLALSVLSVVLDGSMPPDADHVPLLAIYVFIIMLLSAASICIAISITRIGEGTEPSRCFKLLLRCLCGSCDSAESRRVSSNLADPNQETTMRKVVAARLDRLCFVLITSITVIVIIVFSTLCIRCYVTDTCGPMLDLNK